MMALAKGKLPRKGGGVSTIRRVVKKTTRGRGRRHAALLGRRGTKGEMRKLAALRRFEGNPIIVPSNRHEWESQYVLNPAAVYDDGKVHLVYRAIGDGGVSVFGYAASKNGLRVDERLNKPIFAPKELAEREGMEQVIVYVSNSGGSWGGCEDPRITKLEDKFYVTYTAFNGYPRVAITSIKRNDFIAKRWHWREPVFISVPGEIHKNWVIFPEKIKGKYAVLTGISPHIQIAYVDSLDFDGKTFIHSIPPNGEVREGVWDSRPRGVGPPPLRTKDGWLVIYHAIDDRDPGKYKMGAMILDYANPENVLCRSVAPILEPDEIYENDGFKPGVVYSCGAVIIGGTLFVYYGGADTVVCVATIDPDELLTDLRRGAAVKLKKAKMPS